MPLSVRITVLLAFAFIFGIDANFLPFANDETTEVGLQNAKPSSSFAVVLRSTRLLVTVPSQNLSKASIQIGEVCLTVTFTITIINFNINGTNNRIPFNLMSTTISGYCARHARGNALLTATAKHDNRKKKMKFYFITKNVLVKKYEELRWQLQKVVYSETFNGSTVSFESGNSSIVMSAPLVQKFVCKDRLNITLYNSRFRDVIAEFTPEIDVQPYGPKSNFYLCERTRKRTLAESFENKATVFSGIFLGLASLSAMVGNAVRRHFIPERRRIYENLGMN